MMYNHYKTSRCQRWMSREWSFSGRYQIFQGVLMLIKCAHSFIGMTGGAIFHEMMLRQGVKHVCTLFCVKLRLSLADDVE